MWANVRQGMSYATAAGWADKEDREGEVAATEIDEMLAAATCPQRFVPLGFEANGAFGQSTIDFLQLVVRAADQGKSADLDHWSAHVFGEHWQQRLSMVLARGQASLVLGAVAAARNNSAGIKGRKASPEWSATDCQPYVSS